MDKIEGTIWVCARVCSVSVFVWGLTLRVLTRERVIIHCLLIRDTLPHLPASMG